MKAICLSNIFVENYLLFSKIKQLA